MKKNLHISFILMMATCSLLAKSNSEIEFKVLLIIKSVSDTYHPLFLPVQSEMTTSEIADIKRCFGKETPRMIDEITNGSVKFKPTIYVSKKPLKLWEAKRLDSAEYVVQEMVNEFSSIAKPGDYDAVGCYFLHYDTISGYRIPRAGFGVGGYDSSRGLGLFAVNCTTSLGIDNEIFIHEWMHGLDGFYDRKSEVVLPKGYLHGAEENGYSTSPWKSGASPGWLKWYGHYLTGKVKGQFGLGSNAWKHGSIREYALQNSIPIEKKALQIKSYPQWVYELMEGDLSNAKLSESLINDKLSSTKIEDSPWAVNMWKNNIKTKVYVQKKYGGTYVIDSEKANNVSLERIVDLPPEENYLFSAEVMTKAVRIMEKGGKYGVNLHVNDYSSVQDVSGSKTWRSIQIPFTTSVHSKEYKLSLSLGGHASTAKGRVYFRNIQLRKIAYPAGL